MKKLLIKLMMVLALGGLTVQMSSCKAKTNQGDTELVDNADVAKIEAEDDFGGTPDTATDTAVTDESLQAALGESTTDDLSITPEVTETPTPEIAAAPQLDELTLSDGSTAPAPTDNLTTDPGMAEATGITEAPIVETPQETPILADESPILTPEPTGADIEPIAAPVTPKSSLKKLTDFVPYQEGDGWVNTIYIVRPGDTLGKISQKIYGSDKSKELKAINPQLNSRGPKRGEKLLYVSPNRPMDSSKMITFFEDTGMIPETYVAQKNDNIRKLGKTLLGYDNGWQELWSTNPVESKGKLSEGEIIRYYKPAPVEQVAKNDGANVVTDPSQLPGSNNMGMNNPPPSPPQEMMPPPEPPPDMAMNNPPPPPPDMMPPPPPPDMQADANMLPPPPPPPDLPPPPPPAPMEVADAPQAPTSAGMTDEVMEEESAGLIFGLDQVQLALAAVVLIGVVLLILMRVRKKKKEAELAAMSETNVI